MKLNRRKFFTALISFSSLAVTSRFSFADDSYNFHQAVKELEAKSGGRLGVAVEDTQTGKILSYRGNERFALCSTFKVLAAAYVLARVDAGQENLSRIISYKRAQLVQHSPITEKYVDKGMNLAELCDATIRYSDNTAGNLLLESFGGPEKLTEYLHSLGDDITRLDRYEPHLNDVPKGELRDTTTPIAMMRTLNKLLTKNILKESSRKQLQDWMVENTTGDSRLRAGLPKGWKVGDKTGTGPGGEVNDVAIIWPPNRKPLIVTVYYVAAGEELDKKNAVIAAIGPLISSYKYEKYAK